MTRAQAFKKAEFLICNGVQVKVGADFGVWFCEIYRVAK